MTYKNNIPQSTDFISQSQIDFVGNFATVNQIYGVSTDPNESVGDHISLTENNASIIGGHKKTSLVKQASDPSVSSGELAVYSKGSTPEIYYLRSTDASANKLTGRGGISIGGLVLRAYVLFDAKGNVISDRTIDNNGNPVETPIAFNIKKTGNTYNIIQNTPNFADWTVQFANNIPDVNYLWVIQGIPVVSAPGYTVSFGIKNNSTLSQSSINIAGYTTVPGIGGQVLRDTGVVRYMLQIYTVG